MKKLILLFLLLNFCFLCFSLGTEGHSDDMAYIFYEYDSVSDLSKNAPADEKLSFEIMSSGVAFAIDEQGMGKSVALYRKFEENISSTKQGKNYTLPAYSEFPSLGGGRHRAYNHQGYYWDYRDKYIDSDGKSVSTEKVREASNYDTNVATDGWTNKYLERWIMGREKILKPAVASAFNLEVEDYRIEPIAIMFYYAHMLGDLYEGARASINQMGDITTNYYLIMQMKSDLEDSLRSSSSEVYQYLENDIMNGRYSHIAYSVRSCKSRETAYLISKDFMREQFSRMLRMMLDTDPTDITIK